ncbi:PorP/SprF family type IX secretion system membrane protein [Fluviicola sp.]|uniref:PorP/SprF family type IX secretion system membrane protein n=1 Tax=Fluviicola sp. TaxID=1917219 RepID=UPI003D2B1610
MNAKTKVVLLTVTLFLSTQFSLAQLQETTSVLFWNNYLHTNPAMTGAVYKHQANITWNDYGLKKQYVPVGYQQTIYANYSVKLDKINSGIGASYRYDSHSAQQFQTGLLSYAYHIPIKSLFLSIGVSGGIKTLNYEYPSSSSSNVPLVKHKYSPVFSSDFGIALRHEKWNIGVSMTQWNGPTLRLKDSLDDNYKLRAHLWIFGDYRFTLGENWSLTPRAQIVSDNLGLFTNLQVVASWKENLWFGVGVQNTWSGSSIFISPMIGYDIKGRFRLGYTAIISTRNNYGGNLFNRVTHEAVLGFLLK